MNDISDILLKIFVFLMLGLAVYTVYNNNRKDD
jgi:hypothetical protein